MLLKIYFNFINLYLFLMCHKVTFVFLKVYLPFFGGFAKGLLDEFFSAVWVADKGGHCCWCSQRFPIQLPQLVENEIVIFKVSERLPRNKPLAVAFSVPGTHQEYEPLSLERCQSQLSHVKLDLADFIPVIDSHTTVLLGIAGGIRNMYDLYHKIWRKVSVLLLYLLFSSQLIVEWVSLLLLKPIWYLSVGHMLYLHRLWELGEVPGLALPKQVAV